MSADTTRSSFPKGMEPTIHEYYWENFAAHPKVFDKILKIQKTDRPFEQSTSAVGTGLLEERAENVNGVIKAPKEGFTVYGKVINFFKAESVSNELAKDHQKFDNFLKSQMSKWTKDAVATMETYYANIFNYGGYTAGHAMFNATISGAVLTDPSGNYVYDGKPAFNLLGNERTAKDNNTYYNGLALSFSKANLQEAWNLMTITNAKGEDGGKIVNVPKFIIASPAMKFTIDEILKSTEDPTTSNRATNVLRDIVTPIYWHYLTDTNQWTLYNPDLESLIALQRTNPEFEMWYEHLSKTHFMSIEQRYGFMFKNFRPLVSSNFSTVA